MGQGGMGQPPKALGQQQDAMNMPGMGGPSSQTVSAQDQFGALEEPEPSMFGGQPPMMGQPPMGGGQGGMGQGSGMGQFNNPQGKRSKPYLGTGAAGGFGINQPPMGGGQPPMMGQGRPPMGQQPPMGEFGGGQPPMMGQRRRRPQGGFGDMSMYGESFTQNKKKI